MQNYFMLGEVSGYEPVLLKDIFSFRNKLGNSFNLNFMKAIQILELLPGTTGKMLVIWSDRWPLYCSIHKFLFKGWIQNAELLCLCWLLTLEINIASLCLDCFLSRILSIVYHSELLVLCLRFCYRFFVILPVSPCSYYSPLIPSVSPVFCSHLICVLHD